MSDNDTTPDRSANPAPDQHPGPPGGSDLDQLSAEVGALRGRLAELSATVEGHGAVLDDLEEITTKFAEQAEQATSDDGTEPPAVDIEPLARWVHNNVAALVERRTKGDHPPYWCPQWWRHPEAVLKFEGLRRAWVELVPQEGTGLITYLGYLDQVVGSLTAEAGPFHAGGCKPTEHRAVETLDDQPLPATPEPGREPEPQPVNNGSAVRGRGLTDRISPEGP